jgi:hypothetical protein
MTESDAERISRLERQITDLQDRNTELVERLERGEEGRCSTI